MQIYQIKKYEDYELHYSNEVQLVYNRKFKRYLKLCKDKDGYIKICLYRNGKARTFTIHRLVWLCINGDIPKGYEINHMDEDKLNNSIENLELVTPKQNSNHGTRNERMAKALINRQDQSKAVVAVKKDLSEILQYPSTKEAERDRGFKIGNISYCCNNKRKTHKGYIWFFKVIFEEYMKQFNNNLQDVINYKLSLFK